MTLEAVKRRRATRRPSTCTGRRDALVIIETDSEFDHVLGFNTTNPNSSHNSDRGGPEETADYHNKLMFTSESAGPALADNGDNKHEQSKMFNSSN